MAEKLVKRFVERKQVVLVTEEDWPNSDDSQARPSTRVSETILANSETTVAIADVRLAIEGVVTHG